MTSTNSGASQHFGIRTDQVHLEDYWRVVRRRWWLIALTTAVAIGGSLWAASRNPELYQSSMTLQVGDPRGRTGQIGDIDLSPNLLWTDPIESELQQLSTKAVASYVVDTLQLRAETAGAWRYHLLEFVYVGLAAQPTRYEVNVSANGSVDVVGEDQTRVGAGERGYPIEFGGVSLVVRSSAAPGSYRLRILSQSTAEARVSGGLAASVRPETNLIDVTYTGSDRLLAPQVLNATASALQVVGVRRRRDWARARTQFIGEQLAESGESLQHALEDVESYKERSGVTSLEAEEGRLSYRMGELQKQRQELVIERNTYDQLIRDAGNADRPEDIEQFAALTTAKGSRAVGYYFDLLLNLLEERSRQLSPSGKDPSHPDIVALDRRITETRERLIASTQQAAAALSARIAAVQGSARGLARELEALPAVETDLARLKNQVEINSDMYKYLLSRYQESQIAEAEISPYVEVLDPAGWARPVGSGQRINVLFGALLGIGLGIAATFFIEYLDRSIQSSGDLQSVLGLPVLASIPEFAADGRGAAVQLVAESDPDGLPSEAYRVLRTNITFSSSRERALTTLLFTSPGPGEGKTTTVANLASVLAASGDHTLVIDADLRRGEQHEAYDLLRGPGLSDLLVGSVDVREAIRPEVRPCLDVLPSGQRPPNPSELLGSRTMGELLDGWRKQYRWILFDAPPVLAVTDPAVLAVQADAVIVVVRAGETDRRAAWRAYEQLRTVNARVAGAVLNELKASGSRDPYYIDYYYSYGRAS